MIPKLPVLSLVGFAMMAPIASAWPAAGFESPPEDPELGPVFLISLGGKLYDDPWAVLDVEPPAGSNPAIRAAPIAERATWRCVTCHGWSYAGAEVGGVSFPGVRHLARSDAETIKARILDPRHPFPAADLPDLALDLLAFFIRDGLYDPTDFLDARGRALGNAELGRDVFEGACISCHQLDGRRYLQGEHGDRSSLGWVARNRPEQALHKILNGVPAAEMLSLRFLPPEQIADLLSYLQTLDPFDQ